MDLVLSNMSAMRKFVFLVCPYVPDSEKQLVLFVIWFGRKVYNSIFITDLHAILFNFFFFFYFWILVAKEEFPSVLVKRVELFHKNVFFPFFFKVDRMRNVTQLFIYQIDRSLQPSRLFI